MNREQLLLNVPRVTERGISWDVPLEEPKKRSVLARLFSALFGIVVIVVLPFAVLVRASVYLYTVHEAHTWVALTGGAFATVLVLTLYSAVVSKKLTGKARIGAVAKRVALPLVLAYCGYALLYLSSVNAKTPEVREFYRSLHPMLRIAVSTVILADKDMVITDLHRTPEDYQAMGLPARAESLHYSQADGFVHAMDLRTTGRSQWRNVAIEFYFKAAGFETLRHVGTSDHLHVALPLR